MPTIASSSSIDDSSTTIFNEINKSLTTVNELKKTKSLLADSLASEENNDSTYLLTNTLPLVVADAIARIFYMTIKWAKTLPPFSILNSNDQV